MRLWILAVVAVTAVASPAFSQSRNGYGSPGGYGTGSSSRSHGVGGYITNRGKYVQPHYQTNPNNTQYDNYGTRGNYNPYTGRTGRRSPRY